MGKKFEFNITGKFRIKNKSIKTIIQRVVQKCTEIILKRKQSIAGVCTVVMLVLKAIEFPSFGN